MSNVVPFPGVFAPKATPLANDPRDYLNWEMFRIGTATLIERVNDIRRSTLNLWNAHDEDMRNACLGDAAEELDRASDELRDLAFMVEQHMKFIAAHPEMFPVETAAIADRRADLVKEDGRG